MNFFEILNATLLELNYSEVSSYQDLNKPEHVRLKEVVNRLNKEVCSLSDNFYFRQKSKEIFLDDTTIEYPLNFDGKVIKVISKDIIYNYIPDFTRFFTNNPPEFSYSFYGDKMLISPSDSIVNIFYITSKFVKNKNDELKENFENETDVSIIPSSFHSSIFINGSAMNFKQNPSHPKYIHWSKEYEKAIRALSANAKCGINQNTIINGGFRNL